MVDNNLGYRMCIEMLVVQQTRKKKISTRHKHGISSPSMPPFYVIVI